MTEDTNATRPVHLRLDVDAASDEEARARVIALVQAVLDDEENAKLGDAPRVRSWALEEALPEAWEPFIDTTDIPERVGRMFPPEPLATDFRTPAGSLDLDAYEDAADTWRMECLTLADAAANLPSLLQRLEQAENAEEPTGYLPEAFHGMWLPADLIAVSTLRELSEHHPRLMQRLLGPEQRVHLEQVLQEADPDVRIADPEDPDAPELYEGPASEAHAWIPPGVYQATGTEGQGDFRVVVGPSTVGNQQSASAAFPPAEHDAAVVNRTARVLEDHADTADLDPEEVLARIDTLVAETGRITGGSETLIARGALLSDLLARREERLNPDDKGPKPPQHPGPEGLSR